jgi:hypothetical protein
MNERIHAQHSGATPVEQKETKPYTTEVTRVHNKRFAPEGKIFLVIKCRIKNMIYSSAQLVPFGNEDHHAEIFDMMWSNLSAKYNLS